MSDLVRNLEDRFTRVTVHFVATQHELPIVVITKTFPCYIHVQRYFLKAKIENLIGKILILFNILAQKIHCGYTLELPC